MSCHAASKLREKTPKVKVRDIWDFQLAIGEFVRRRRFARKLEVVTRKFYCRNARGGGDILSKA